MLRVKLFIAYKSDFAVFPNHPLKGFVGHPHAMRVVLAPGVQDTDSPEFIILRGLKDGANLVNGLCPTIDANALSCNRKLLIARNIVAPLIRRLPRNMTLAS